jgi:hypothetical protein
VVELVERDHQVQLGLSFARALPRGCRRMRELRQGEARARLRTPGRRFRRPAPLVLSALKSGKLGGAPPSSARPVSVACGALWDRLGSP